MKLHYLAHNNRLRLALAIVIAICMSPVSATPVGSELTDPTQPNWFGVSKAKKKANSLVLNSLVTGPQRRIAVINGELMREGEKKYGITVDQILDDRVLVVTKSGKKRVLKLKKSSSPVKVPRGTAR